MEDIKLLKSYVDAELKKGVTELSKPMIEMVRLIYKELKGRYLPVVTASRSLGFIPAHTVFSYGNHETSKIYRIYANGLLYKGDGTATSVQYMEHFKNMVRHNFFVISVEPTQQMFHLDTLAGCGFIIIKDNSKKHAVVVTDDRYCVKIVNTASGSLGNITFEESDMDSMTVKDIHKNSRIYPTKDKNTFVLSPFEEIITIQLI